MRRVILLVMLLAALSVVAASCRGTVDVRIDVAENGSGTVQVTLRLDAAAARELGDPATALAVDDLTAAGWKVQSPQTTDDGSLTVVGTRAFASPDDLPVVLDEIGGTDGVFDDVSLTIEDGFGRTAYGFDARVVLSGSLEQFSDEALTQTLGGLAFGRTPEELARSGVDDPDAATLRLVVDLPGEDTTADGEIVDGVAEWEFAPNNATAVDESLGSQSSLGSSASTLRTLALGLAVAAIAALIAGLVVRARR